MKGVASNSCELDVDPVSQWQLWATGKVICHETKELDLIFRVFFSLLDPLIDFLVGALHICSSEF